MFGHKEPLEEEIALRAHELYLKRGGERGKDVEDWARAEKELTDERVAGPAKTKREQLRWRKRTRASQDLPESSLV